jgi:hypothetical protein
MKPRLPYSKIKYTSLFCNQILYGLEQAVSECTHLKIAKNKCW